MSTKTKPKPRKAPASRVMWANYYTTEKFPCVHPLEGTAKFWPEGRRPVMTIRVAVTPLDDVEAIVERAAKASLKLWQNTIGDPSLKEMIRAALTAAGIPCKRRARK